MGLSIQPSSRSKRRSARLTSDINVTPLIDVMLVLLIVFMITAPLMTVGVPVDLPQSKAPVIQEQEEPLVVTVTAQNELFIQETRVPFEELIPRLQAITQQNPEARVFVRGDKSLSYGQMMHVVGAIYGGGFRKVALITEPLGEGNPPQKRPSPSKK